MRKEIYKDEVQAMHPHDTKFWKKSSGVGGYAPAGLAKDRSGAKDPCVTSIESLGHPSGLCSPISRHTVKVSTRERAWSGEIFPTELFPGNRETCRFLGFAFFQQDGRALNHNEQEGMMWRAAALKFPCSRPALYDEYAEGRILGLPERNVAGAEVVFGGLSSRGDAPATHKGWVLGGYPKRCVLTGDPFDGQTETASSFGRKAVLCVLPQRRLVRQPSLRITGGEARYDLWRARSQPDLRAAEVHPSNADYKKTYEFTRTPLLQREPGSTLLR